MSRITHKEILKIAAISNIILSENEIEQMSVGLSQVLDYAICVAHYFGDVVTQKNEVFGSFRPDIQKIGLGTELVMQSVQHDADYFVVPLILEQ